MPFDANINATSVLGDGSQEAAPPAPQIVADYKLEEKIGGGGYGEVWRAIGPGGLPKAIKILFGKLDGPQADAELRSLERIRALRHPFLLNIERIEVCDQRLIVVTELADGCLEDVFNKLRDEGGRGVPRDNLLGYLRDAADALDFMAEQHGLQHLDIKPENLLVQGDHIKVGDFGLIKSINDPAISLIGGFTPLYAPPELFEGQPSDRSDQYSLAIVYQMMLTGVPPFSGRTAAQLAAQHLNSKPDLSPLQPVDRPVVARALSKNHHARFQSCRQFIDELSKRRNARVRWSGPTGRGAPADLGKTAVVDPASMIAPEELPALETTPLPPPDADRAVATYRPTVFIGVGGLAAQVLCSLRQRFRSQFGEESELPSFPLLLIDSDANFITDLCSRGGGELQRTETVGMPLRTLGEFRNDPALQLDWLSRRWLYNIPKSGNVDGIRPLGRLAFVDHRRRIGKQIERVLSNAVADDAVRATARETGLPLRRGAPRVVLVASTTGGTSSGAALDVAYLARQVCDELDMEPETVTGVLLHGTGTTRQLRDVQDANTMSFLRELNHFSAADKENPDYAPPFDFTYFVHFGDDLNQRQFSQKASDVASYLFGNTAAAERAHFEQWRQLSLEADASFESQLRTVGVASIEESSFQLLNGAARRLCGAAMKKWVEESGRENRSTRRLPAIDLAETKSMLVELELTAERLTTRAIGVLRGATGKQLDAYAGQVADKLSGSDAAGDVKQLFPAVRAAILNSPTDSDQSPQLAAIITGVNDQLPISPESAAVILRDHIVAMLDQAPRIRGAGHVLAAIV
ncbi:MAG: tubulin-like doman-containing protein, partial [Pirellulaceae bacterium]|nr:tubulin-like doman-containing protein [Pirellulaceae bacterium]